MVLRRIEILDPHKLTLWIYTWCQSLTGLCSLFHLLENHETGSCLQVMQFQHLLAIYLKGQSVKGEHIADNFDRWATKD